MLSKLPTLALAAVLLLTAGCDSPTLRERTVPLGTFEAETDGEFYGTSLSGTAMVERGDSSVTIVLRDDDTHPPGFTSPQQSFVFLRRTGGLPEPTTYPVSRAFVTDSTGFGAGWTIGTFASLPSLGVLGARTGTVRITDVTSAGVRGEMEITFQSGFDVSPVTTMRGRFYARFE